MATVRVKQLGCRLIYFLLGSVYTWLSISIRTTYICYIGIADLLKGIALSVCSAVYFIQLIEKLTQLHSPPKKYINKRVAILKAVFDKTGKGMLSFITKSGKGSGGGV